MATLLSGAVGEHERALGGWQAELVTIPDLVDAAGGALDALERIAAGLVVDPERMTVNLQALQGLVFSERLARLLARDMDRASALALVEDWSAQAVKERRQLRDVALAARPALAGAIDGVLHWNRSDRAGSGAGRSAGGDRVAQGSRSSPGRSGQRDARTASVAAGRWPVASRSATVTRRARRPWTPGRSSSSSSSTSSAM